MKHTIRLLAAAAVMALLAFPVQAHEKGDWIFRAGVGVVAPDNPVYSESGLGVEVDDGTSLTLMGTYMFTENWAFDVLAAWPFAHEASLVADGMSIPLAEFDHLPPTFSVQYHFIPAGNFQPYVGLGLNYTTFFSIDIDPNLAEALDALGSTIDLDLDDSFGIAAQVGADIMINERWLFNVDLRYIDLQTDATLTVDGSSDSPISLDVNPWVYSLNVGYKF
jgi:outer membrane protein